MNRINKFGRITLVGMAVIVLVVALVLIIGALPACTPGDQGISIGHMLVEGCN